MSQSLQKEVNSIHDGIIRERENQISILKQKKNNLIEEIKLQEEYLVAYKKVVATVPKLEVVN